MIYYNVFYIGIDLGTYLCRFVLATKTKVGIKYLKYNTCVVNFGVIKENSQLSKMAIKRLELIFRKFIQQIDSYRKNHSDDYRVRCVATAAFRSSLNSEQIIDHVYKKFKIKIEIIEPIEEIYLASLGCQFYIKNVALVMDIGSGSTEIALILKKNNELVIQDYISLNCGLMNNIVKNEKERELEKLKNFMQQYKIFNYDVLCTKCGTLNIVYDDYYLSNFIKKPNFLLDMKKITLEMIEQTVNKFAAMSYKDFSVLKHIGSKKTCLIQLGLPWVYLLLQYVGCNEVILCDTGLKEGIVIDMCKNQV